MAPRHLAPCGLSSMVTPSSGLWLQWGHRSCKVITRRCHHLHISLGWKQVWSLPLKEWGA